jgi:hypothetical protein
MNYSPPGALDSHGWSLFNEEYKENAPIRYWIMHDLRYGAIMPVKWKYQDLMCWIRYRTTERNHVVNTGLKPGYHSADTQLLHVSFNILKDFVEVELAWRERWSDKSTHTLAEKYLPFYFVFFPFREPNLGIQSLEWQATLDDPNLPPYEQSVEQAVNAREILALYRWWLARDKRPEAKYPEYDKQGLGEMACLHPDFDTSAPDYVAHQKATEDRQKQDEEWQNEDTQMLIRLAKVRQSLWA